MKQSDVQRKFLLALKHVPCPTRDDIGDCWEFTGALDKDRYGKVRFNGKVERANRVSYLLFVGSLPDRQVVAHACDNPPCCRPSHLRATSQKLNCQDKIDRGRQVNVSVIPPEEVPKIREALSRNPKAGPKLARKYGCSPSTIKALLAGQTWRLDMRGLT